MAKLNLDSLGEPVRKKGAQVFFNCPFHEDEHGHLGVHLKRRIFHCFKCGVSGKLDELETPLTAFEERVKAYLFGGAEEKVQQTLSLPQEYQPISHKSGIPYRYLRDRLVTDEEIRRYSIGYCGEGQFADRIIVPIYDRDILKYFVGRTYTNRVPKYMNAPVPKGDVIFRTSNKREEKAIVCEGIFDALRIGKVFPAISLLGKVINGGEQAMAIVKATKRAYVMLDKDASKDAFIAASILNYYIPTHVMFLDSAKDPGSMTTAELKRILPK